MEVDPREGISSGETNSDVRGDLTSFNTGRNTGLVPCETGRLERSRDGRIPSGTGEQAILSEVTGTAFDRNGGSCKLREPIRGYGVGPQDLVVRRESQQDLSTGHVSAGEKEIPSLCVKAVLGDPWHGVSGLGEPGICSGEVETRVTQACGGISGTGGGVGSGDLDRNGHAGIECEGISRDVVSCRPCVESSDCHV